MRFLRRNTTESPALAEPDTDPASEQAGERKAHAGGKGRPTPKRREAEGRRRGPVPPPPRTQREAFRRGRGNKEERRASAADRRERMMAGDERYLLPRDRGPVKAYVRDVVDGRRNILGLFMPLAVLVLASLFTPSPAIQQYASLLCTLMLLVMIVEGLVLARIVSKKVRRKFPNSTERAISLGWYAFSRASQLRRLRVPRPRVGYGQLN